ncbi:hypothetical protein RhiXN_03190 [Rhizoctonia solani]|uniref:Uncharacterized protein n=1 Tax=Rhizoctonia solani TaxID=456999 RepID=A0A8H8STU7_9AGAM|nr:uncharacterized protein RhiXN_03190 [Rhizoctonia solani]QRW18266.1 hypothetical protein RhiXN_03190 [Rhizoctonia solani]
MFTRAIRPSVNAARRVAVPAPRYTSQRTNDPEVLEREKHKNLRGEQHSPHTHAPGWNEALASDSEAVIKADQATGTPQEMASSTLEYMKKQHLIHGPLGALARGAKKAVDALAEAAATDHEDVQGHLSDKGARLNRPVALR